MGKSFSEFLKATLIGGLLFLVPGVLIVIILGKAMQLARRVTEPIYDALPDAVFGVGVATVISVLVLVLIAFVAGLLARTKFGKRIGASLEHSLLGGLPQYQMVKSMAEGMAQVESTDNVTPVLVSVEDAWQIGYLLEPLENGWVAAFLPQAPTPMSGNVMYLPADRVRPLAITMVQAMAIVKRMGVGSADALRGTDLTLPGGSI
ncbi:MAG: DUF502 domain-containing protein [Methyloceanibacter sp.]